MPSTPVTSEPLTETGARTIRITAIEIVVVRGAAPEPPPGPKQRQVRAESFHERRKAPYSQPAAPWTGGVMTSRYLRIGTDAGAEGLYGPIDPETTWPIVNQLAPLLIGEDALAVTTHWDLLERFDRHGRHGHYKMALSAIDNALWDLRGKVFDAPVWQLLGGSARDRIPVYLSTLGTSLDLDNVREVAAKAKADGFWGQKWFLGDGPTDGAEGLARNVAIAEAVRETIGPDERMMFDVFNGWDLGYARSWVQRVEHLKPTWLEEPFGQNHFPAYEALQRSTSVPISTGEHIYDRQELLQYLQAGVLAVAQCDPEWCGGVTELVRMCAIADVFSVPVIPHGHGMHAAIHVIASQSPAVCPTAEYLGRTMPNRHHFEIDPPAPVGGSFALPTRPGFGIRLDDSKIDERSTLQF
ncbi:enolase C-terminal domain-like protein [Gryllotalpicola reticulitermitis]|uniref:Enolase C-terminal domain-like protein n=1 Tax=Gryllotalpicola reticulitermitis TaxID=1184153 RepID=A0ABV8Q741_9MICO